MNTVSESLVAALGLAYWNFAGKKHISEELAEATEQVEVAQEEIEKGKEALEAAFHGVGGAEYLMRQAEQNPQAFMTLLGKIIPAQVHNQISNPDGSLRPTIDPSKLSTAALNEILAARNAERS